MKKGFQISLSLLLIALFLIVAFVSLQHNTLRTLASLRKVNDYPLYTMHYYGDYGFDALLRDGVQSSHPTSAHQQLLDMGWACTCFAALHPDGDKIFGRNFDWYEHPILLLFTDPPGGYASVSMVDISYLGFDRGVMPLLRRAILLRAPFLPFDGMNEYGLAVGMMAVPHAEGGNDPHKITLTELQVIRNLLDHARTVTEALDLLAGYNVRFDDPPLHYLIADASGDSAVIEFIAGEMNVIRHQSNWQVSTNFLLQETSRGEERARCWRYALADTRLEDSNGLVDMCGAMDILQAASQPRTIWSVVYNLTNGKMNVAVAGDYETCLDFELNMHSH